MIRSQFSHKTSIVSNYYSTFRMYIGKPGLGKGRLPLSEKRKPDISDLSVDLPNRTKDTNQAIQHFNPGSRNSGHKDSITESSAEVNGFRPWREPEPGTAEYGLTLKL